MITCELFCGLQWLLRSLTDDSINKMLDFFSLFNRKKGMKNIIFFLIKQRTIFSNNFDKTSSFE